MVKINGPGALGQNGMDLVIWSKYMDLQKYGPDQKLDLFGLLPGFLLQNYLCGNLSVPISLLPYHPHHILVIIPEMTCRSPKH